MKKRNRLLSGHVGLVLLTTLLISACGSTPYRQVVLDRDNDSVPDEQDDCQVTPPNNPVDESGCALFRGSIEAVEFAPGDYRLNAASRDSLAELVLLLNLHPTVVLRLGGHTDNLGAARENLALSKQRVMSVVRYLVANGIDAARLEPFGFCESRPIISNMTSAGRAQNRRIEMSVVTQ